MNKDELEKYKQSLPPGVLKDMQIGGKTRSPMGDLAMLGATGAAVKAAPLMIGGAKNLLKNEVGKMTISNAAFKKGLLPELTKGGIKNWQHLRPWKAFTPQMLKTGPTPAAALALGGLAINEIRKNPLGIRNAVLDKIGTPQHYKSFIKYLTGGAQGGVERNLDPNVVKDVVREHLRGRYPDRFKMMQDEGGKAIPNPNYDPKSTQLDVYGSARTTGSQRTLGTLGSTQFQPVYEGDKLTGYRIFDRWDVDDSEHEAQTGEKYRPFKDNHFDLTEGGVVASRAHDVAKLLGTAKDYDIDVFVPIKDFNKYKSEIEKEGPQPNTDDGDYSKWYKWQQNIEKDVPYRDKRSPTFDLL